MTRIPALLLAVTIGVASCAAYNKCVAPEITAATKLAPADLLKEVSAFLLCGGPDLPDLAAPCAVAGLADLALALGPGGDQAVNCLVSYLEGNATGVLQSRAKAVGAKRGVTPELFSAHACNGLQIPAPHQRLTMDERAAIHIALPAISHASCNIACGEPKIGLATPDGCTCWRASRWVALAR